MGRLLEPHPPNLEESRSELVNTGFWRENVFQKPTAALARADFGKRESPVSPRVAWPVPSRFLHLLFASPRNFPQGHSGAHPCPRCVVGLNGTTRGSLWSFLPDSVALGYCFCAGLSGRILAAHTWFLLHHLSIHLQPRHRSLRSRRGWRWCVRLRLASSSPLIFKSTRPGEFQTNQASIKPAQHQDALQGRSWGPRRRGLARLGRSRPASVSAVPKSMAFQVVACEV